MLGKVYAPYLTSAMQHRSAQQAAFQNFGRRASRIGRTDSKASQKQPYGVYGPRTMTAEGRRIAVQRARAIYENNVLGRSLLDRATDNVIGEGMWVRPMTSDEGFNKAAKEWWDNVYQADSRGLVDNRTLQRRWYRNWKRDGDLGGILLKNGQVQTIETDLIQSPQGSGDQFGRTGRPEIVDGVKLTVSGRPTTFYVQSVDASGQVSWPGIPFRNFLFIADTDRDDYTAVRGIPTLATIGWLLEQIDGTIEAVTLAHRMAASFGLVHKMASPGKAAGFLPTTTNANGNVQPKITIEPASQSMIGHDDDIIQIKPEHPTTQFSEFMSTLVRFAGLNLGLPLELAMLDFSKTNYSSARASMEQAYRGFRIQQRRFADCWLSKWYRWRISKAVNLGELSGAPDDFQRHQWYGQPWPYLNPVDDAKGTLAAQDAGMSTLSDDLTARGTTLDEFVELKAAENKKLTEAGVPILYSTVSRESSAAMAGRDPEPEPDTQEQDDEQPDNAD